MEVSCEVTDAETMLCKTNAPSQVFIIHDYYNTPMPVQYHSKISRSITVAVYKP